MEQNTKQSLLLHELLTHPDTTDHAALGYLRQLVQDYPQSGLLQALYACSGNRDGLKKAAVYINSLALYRLAHAPASLPAIHESQLLTYAAPAPVASITPEVNIPAGLVADASVAAPGEEPQMTDAPEQAGEAGLTAVESDTQPIIEETQPVQEAGAEQVDDVPDTELLSDEQLHPDIEPAAETETEPAEVMEDVPQEVEITAPEATFTDAAAATEQVPETAPEPVAELSDEDEIYEEIVGIEDINFSLINRPVAPLVAADALADAVEPVEAEEMPEPAEEPSQPEAAVAEQQDEVETANAQQPEAEAEVTQENVDSVITEAEVDAGATPHEPVKEEITEAANAPEQLPETEAVPTLEQEEESPAAEEPAADPEAASAAEQPAENVIKPANETERLIIENIAATDYFIFDKAFRDRNAPEAAPEIEEDPIAATAPEPVAETTAAPAEEQEQPEAEVEETHDVSKYHDEKMPYSFMWWLDKTRREHASIYQPYAKPPAGDMPHQDHGGSQQQPAVASDEHLQHQYIESILHSTPVKGFEPEAAQNIPVGVRSKEHKIIERFIQEEPHIKPPSSDKLGSENKAKKSAEDSDELITETLARIYTDQMLYAKAIATYKKLKLKYPEKSSYFAGQISALEKKIN